MQAKVLVIAALSAMLFTGLAVAQKQAMPGTADEILNEILAIKGQEVITAADDARMQALYRRYLHLTRTGGGIPGKGMNGAEDCATATTVFSGAFMDSDDTTGAADDMGQVNVCLNGIPFIGTGVAPDLVYQFVPPVDGTIIAAVSDTTGADLNIRILDDSLVAGDPCLDPDGSCLNVADGFFGGATETVISFLSAGTSYYVVIDGYSGDAGPYDLDVQFGASPPNNECATAIPVSCDTVTMGNNVDAGPNGVTTCGDSAPEGAHTVWYSLASPGNGTVTVDTCGAGTDFDTQLNAYDGTCTGLNCLDGNDDFCSLQSQISFPVVFEEDYWIMVTGFAGAEGNFDLNVDCSGVEFVFPTIEIPTLNRVGMLALVLALISGGVLLLRRRRA